MLQLSRRLTICHPRGRFLRANPAYLSSERLYQGNGVLGMVREEYGMWERRAPLSPDHVKTLTSQGFKVLVQPCTRRIFSDGEYLSAGAVVQESVDEANLIIGVKKMPDKQLKAGKSYLFFSHVIKAQPANMSMLDKFLDQKMRLFDYECITDGGRDDTRRLVAFGKFAGLAGMIDGLQGLGQRLLADGYSNPFLNVPMSFMHADLAAARQSLLTVGEQIKTIGLHPDLAPLVFCFTGSGNVANGAKEIFELLPHEYIQVSELKTLAKDIKNGKRDRNKLYGVNVITEMVRPKAGSGLSVSEPVNAGHYFANPDMYEPCFHETIAPYITMLINGIYWDNRFPRLLTKDQLAELWESGNTNLKMVADISCDINGSLELLTQSTTIEKPYFSYLPKTRTQDDTINKDGILVLGVDILPSELPRDASHHFSKALVELIPPILRSGGASAEDPLADLSAEMKRACIASHGELMPHWTYIARLREQAAVLLPPSPESVSAAAAEGERQVITNMELRGHLFDTGLINAVLNILDELSNVTVNGHNPLHFSIAMTDVRANMSSGPVPSRVTLRLGGEQSAVDHAAAEVRKLVESHPSADGRVDVFHQHLTKAGVPAPSAVTVRAQKRVLLFGSGRVAKPVLKLLDTHDDVYVTVASEDPAQGQELVDVMRGGGSKARFQPFKFPHDNDKLPNMIRDCDVAISLLPATMHIPLAEEAIRQHRHLVTASYVSPAMRALHDRAVAAGVILLNEVGLDPGIDHMMIMHAIDSIHARGGTVTDLVSLCGGLPDPVAADNPFLYKISWSPRGVLMAARNSARYLAGGEIVSVPGDRLLVSAQSSNRFPTMRLEVIPNRDSLEYRELYGVPDVSSICRGTLRYQGWANVMQSLKVLNLMDLNDTNSTSWLQLLEGEAKKYSADVRNISNIDNKLVALLRAEGSVVDPVSAVAAIRWLGLLGNDKHFATHVPLKAGNPLDALCKVMEERLQFKENERDMVAMFHTIVGRFPDGTVEHHTSRLLDFGETGHNGDSAMSKTVGYTTGAAAELILNGMLGTTGVLIPSRPEIYNPMLKRIQDFGITWTDRIEVIKPAGK